MRDFKHKQTSSIRSGWKKLFPALALSLAIASFIGLHTVPATAAKYYCGTGEKRVQTSIDFGCKGQGTALIDMLFAIIRFLSAGVGVVIVASTVYAGVMYTVSRGDPQAVAAAVTRLRNNVIALGLFIFGYAILNYLIPAGFFT